MPFDFDDNEDTTHLRTTPLLFSAIMGQSGAGKSGVCGTFGVPTLYLFAGGEDHGVSSAITIRDKLGMTHPIRAVRFDQGRKDGAVVNLTPDQSIARLHQILTATDDVKKAGFGAVVIDGATELCHLIRESSEWENACKTKSGGHNTYAENDATTAILRRIILPLKRLQEAVGCHVAITSVLDVRSTGDMGEVEVAVPRLPGYGVAESLIQMCGDVLVIGKMTKDGVSKRKLQFMVDVERISKDEAQRVKKAINYNPRLKGVETLPPFLDADLREVLKLKRGDKLE